MAYQPDPVNAPGELYVDFSPVEQGRRLRQEVQTNYWILDVVEDQYSAVYSCEEDGAGGVLTEFAWVLTREMDPPQNVVSLLLESY